MTIRSAGRKLPALALGLLAGGCASAPEPETEAALGCYQFERTEGVRLLNLPWGFRLEGDTLSPDWPVAQRSPDAREALTMFSPHGWQEGPFGYWLRTAGDTIEIGYPGFGAGWVLRLAPSGQDLIGLGRSVGDAVPPDRAFGPDPWASVTARRVLCGAS
jgi:hypothetical protein